MTTETAIDVLTLARALIRCPSVTPEDAGALDHLQRVLEGLGFACHRLRFSETGTADVDNLYARFGRGRPNFCFAGHTDVVPVGDRAAWSVDPFEAAVVDGMLYGRGATDMKGAIACFAAAADRFLRARGGDFGGSISLLITGDEEGPAINGTRKVLDWMTANGETIDHCLVGEPTNPRTLGEMVKIGRRGTLSGQITMSGTQGHVAYPQLADNPIPRLIAVLSRLLARRLDEGDSHFQPSNLEITTIDVGNPASNVIPAQAMAQFNIRFNPAHTGDGLSAWIREQCEAIGGDYRLDLRVGGEPFLTPPGTFSALIGRAIQDATRTVPEFSTTGGTSDARFIRAVCPVAEFGLISQSMHKVDERVAVGDLRALVEIYERILRHYFA